MKHTSKFTSEVEVGQVVRGISQGIAKNGRITYTTAWSGVYEGVKTSEWNGEPVHSFRDGIVGNTPQGHFASPTSQFEA